MCLYGYAIHSSPCLKDFISSTDYHGKQPDLVGNHSVWQLMQSHQTNYLGVQRLNELSYHTITPAIWVCRPPHPTPPRCLSALISCLLYKGENQIPDQYLRSVMALNVAARSLALWAQLGMSLGSRLSWQQWPGLSASIRQVLLCTGCGALH